MANANPTAEHLEKIIFPQGGRYLYGALSGPAKAIVRQQVMAAFGITLPRSKCGLTVVMDQLTKWAGASGCSSVIESAIVDKLIRN